jgi:hypothetical protein
MSCDKKMTFEECELAVLRSAVDKIDKKTGRNKINDPDIKEIIRIVEDFLKLTKRVCYGGTAINNILPLQDQFYDKTTELPDYDFFSPEPLKDAKKLADIYYAKGFTEVEAKSGMHPGTFKVYVNFLPIADITYLIPELYKSISKKAIQVASIYYCPPNYLRMAMYLELSRPDGDVSRWEKVLKRLTLLNKHYPMKGKNCRIEDIQRLFQYGTKKDLMNGGRKKIDYDDEEEYLENIEERIFYTVRDVLMGQGCVFFGAYANRMYLKKLKYLQRKRIPRVPDFDVLSDDPETAARILKERLDDLNLKKVSIKKKDGVGEIIAPHYEVSVGPETVAFIYEPLECHSYNVIDLGPHKMRIATLDTMLSFYLAFIYVNRPYYDVNRILCMSKFLFKVQQKNRLSQKGLLRRFSPDCYGVQSTMEKMREEKAEKYRELKNKRGSKDYEWYFLRYIPSELNKNNKPHKKKKKRKKRKKRRKTKKKSLLGRLGFGGKRKRRKTKRKRR